MTTKETLLIIIIYSIASILLIKYYKYLQKKKGMILITGNCTDIIYKTGYNKNTIVYYYDFIFEKEKYSICDKTRFKLPFFNIKINGIVKIYIDKNNPNYNITPLENIFSNIYLLLSIILFILPFFI